MCHTFCTTMVRVYSKHFIESNMDNKPRNENEQTMSSDISVEQKNNKDSCVDSRLNESINDGYKNSCNCNDDCKCRLNGNKTQRCCVKCKNCLSIALSVFACILACVAMLKNGHKSATSPMDIQNQSVSQIDDGKIRTTIIDIIKNDPQLLIDAMSAGIAKQRADLSKQQAQSVEKYKNDLLNTAYMLGNKEAKQTVLCLFDPICNGCIEFQHVMLKALKNKKDVCFYIIPIAALGERAEEVAKAYYAVCAKDPSKLIDFITEIIKDPSNLEFALKEVSVSQKDLEQFKNAINQKLEANLSWLDKLQINSVPAIFIKSSGGKFTSIEESELINVLK